MSSGSVFSKVTFKDDLTVSEDEVILRNICEKKNLEMSYKKCGRGKTLMASHKNILPWNQFDYLVTLIKDIFLPKGYPNSVSSDYLEYQLWDTCQAFFSSISGTLSMSAIMAGVGVGSSAATPVSAAITWIMKDGTGMVGSILFAWAKGSKLDSDCKKWRLFADFINDVAMCIELYIPYVVQYSVFLLCVSTALKALVGVAGSATRAALTCHQAIQGNMADVSAKDGSQEIFINLCAYIFGIFLLKNVTEAERIWSIMCIFVLLHLFSNYKAVSCLKINVFNRERYRLSLRSFVATSYVPTVEQVNRNESVILGMGTTDMEIFGYNICLGASLEKAVRCQGYTADDLMFLSVMFQSRNYLVMPYIKEKKILVAFRKSFENIDILQGYFHAVLTAAAITLQNNSEPLPFVKRRRNNSPITRLDKLIKEYVSPKRTELYRSKSIPVSAILSSDEIVEREFTTFCKLSLDRGWNLSKNLVLIDDWTAEWKHVLEKKPEVSPQTRRETIPLMRKKRSYEQAVLDFRQYKPDNDNSSRIGLNK